MDSPPGKSDHVLTFTFNAYLDGSNTEKMIHKFDKADYKKMIETGILYWRTLQLINNGGVFTVNFYP